MNVLLPSQIRGSLDIALQTYATISFVPHTVVPPMEMGYFGGMLHFMSLAFHLDRCECRT